MSWRNAFGLLSKKNRTYTVAGVITFVFLTYLVYKYVLPEKAKAWVYSWVAKPSLGSPGWEEQTFGKGTSKISVGDGGGLTAGDSINVSS